MNDLNIREAVIDDLPEMLSIYNYEVEFGISTFDLIPKTLEERKQWFYEHNIGHHPLYVAELDNHIAGYVSLSSYRPKEAYNSTVELSVYINKDDRGKGIATELMKTILKYARENQEIHTVVSVITSGNAASVKLHQVFGFEFCGTIREVGIKFGKYRDIDNYRLGVADN